MKYIVTREKTQHRVLYKPKSNEPASAHEYESRILGEINEEVLKAKLFAWAALQQEGSKTYQGGGVDVFKRYRHDSEDSIELIREATYESDTKLVWYIIKWTFKKVETADFNFV